MLNDKDFEIFIDIFSSLITFYFTWLKLYPKRKSQNPSVSYICNCVFYVGSCFEINVICFILDKSRPYNAYAQNGCALLADTAKT